MDCLAFDRLRCTMPIPSWKSGLQEIAANVFAYIHSGVGWDICNSGFIVGDDGVMVIDAMMVASMVDPYLEEIRRVTDKPIRYVINTHHHVDHSFGNQFYLPAEVVSHQGCREAMLTRGADVNMLNERWPQYREDWAKTRLTPATVTYQDKMVIHLGDRVIELLHPGPTSLPLFASPTTSKSGSRESSRRNPSRKIV